MPATSAFGLMTYFVMFSFLSRIRRAATSVKDLVTCCQLPLQMGRRVIQPRCCSVGCHLANCRGQLPEPLEINFYQCVANVANAKSICNLLRL